MTESQKLDKVHNKIVQQISENMKSYGYQGTIGQVIAAIYYHNDSMSLDELAEHTGMSKTRMSQVLREMAHLNIAEKVYVKGTRKDYYTVEADYYRMFISLFTSNWREVVMRNKKIDEEIMAELNDIITDENANEEEIQKAKAYLEDTKESVAFFDWVDKLVTFFDTKEVFEHIPKPTQQSD
ncbi:GbsR/MarR family transcriptional regulator [Lentibacillus persicus]|uniref:GbsR/MarR family transcriptional regulator n=1 Tax=Lentibacillus persicus TaxID=640948 RepID=UPI000B7E84DB|nr:MarR family transcriptional regulator [Lentibacillus persicus]